jgi:hypothetical protein
MTKRELPRFRAMLAVRFAQLAHFTCKSDGITLERSADPMEEIQAASQRALAFCDLAAEFRQLRNARQPRIVETWRIASRAA